MAIVRRKGAFDQTVLHGALNKVCDVAMPLLSVNHVKHCQAEASDANKTYDYLSKKEEKK